MHSPKLHTLSAALRQVQGSFQVLADTFPRRTPRRRLCQEQRSTGLTGRPVVSSGGSFAAHCATPLLATQSQNPLDFQKLSRKWLPWPCRKLQRHTSQSLPPLGPVLAFGAGVRLRLVGDLAPLRHHRVLQSGRGRRVPGGGA